MTLTFNLMTWLSWGIIYSSNTIYMKISSSWSQVQLRNQLHTALETDITIDRNTDMWKQYASPYLKRHNYCPFFIDLTDFDAYCWIWFAQHKLYQRDNKNDKDITTTVAVTHLVWLNRFTGPDLPTNRKSCVNRRAHISNLN